MKITIFNIKQHILHLLGSLQAQHEITEEEFGLLQEMPQLSKMSKIHK